MLETILSRDNYEMPGFGGFGNDSPTTIIQEPPTRPGYGGQGLDFPNHPGASIMPGMTMYCFDFDRKDFKPDKFLDLGIQTGIGYGNLSDLGGDLHESFKIDRYGNIYGGHTTYNIPRISEG